MPRPKGARDAGYPAKRSALLRKLSSRLAAWDETHPSLRQLAVAAQVTVPTLRHYFGSREDLVEAVFGEFRRLGDPYLAESARPKGALGPSIRSYLDELIRAMTQEANLGDVFAVGLAEGMLNRRLGPAYLANMTDPLIDALAQRLSAHQARGEMVAADPVNAALMLIAPVVVACNHQNQMNGRPGRPLDVDRLAEEMTEAFVRAFGVAHPAHASQRSDH